MKLHFHRYLKKLSLVLAISLVLSNFTGLQMIFAEEKPIADAGSVEWSFNDIDLGSINDIIFQNGKFTAVTNKGRILNSADGANWNIINQKLNCDLKDITYGNKYVAVGNAVCVSDDGENWTTISDINLPSFTCVVWGNGYYLAWSGDYHWYDNQFKKGMYKSVDGIKWEKINDQLTEGILDEVGDISGFSFGKGVFAAVYGANKIITSTNGVDWKTVSFPTEEKILGISYCNGKFFGTGSKGNLFVSSDGISWDVVDTGGSSELYKVTYNKDRYFASGIGLMESSDGKKWIEVNMDTSRLGTDFKLTCIESGNGYIAGAGIYNYTYYNSEVNFFMSSQTGLDWVYTTMGYNVNDIEYYKGKYIAAGNNGTVLTSDDGYKWALRCSGTAENLYSIAYNDGLCIAVGQNGVVVETGDGIDWGETVVTEGNPDFADTIFGNGIFLALDSENNVYTSKDGKKWAWKSRLGSDIYKRVAFGHGAFVVPSGDRLLLSKDGHDWTDRKAPSDIENIFFSRNLFIAAGNEGEIMTSSNLTKWNEFLAEGSGINEFSYGGGFLAAGNNGTLLYSDEGKTWSKITIQIDQYTNLYDNLRFCAGNKGIYVLFSYNRFLTIKKAPSQEWSETDDGTVIFKPTPTPTKINTPTPINYKNLHFSGKVVIRKSIEPKYDFVGKFVDDVAVVNVGCRIINRKPVGGKWGLIDRKANLIVPLKYDSMDLYLNSGLVKFEQSRKMGAFNKFGNIVIKPKYSQVYTFSHGLAKVRTGSLYGYVDSKGNEIIKPGYDNIWYQGYGYSALFKVKKSGKYGYISLSGKILVKPLYEEISNYSSYYIKVKKDGKYGYVDKNGKEIVKPLYEEIGYYDYSMNAKMNGKYGLIDNKGKTLIKFDYDEIIAAGIIKNRSVYKIKKNGKYGFTYKSSNEIIAPVYDEIFYYNSDYIFAGRNGKCECISWNGDVINTFNFEKLSFLEGNYFTAYQSGKLGVYDLKSNQQIIPIKYDSISLDYYYIQSKKTSITKTILKLCNDGKYGYADMNGKIFIEPQYSSINLFNSNRCTVNLGGELKDNKIIGGKWGLYDLISRKLLIKEEYSTISLCSFYSKYNEAYLLSKDGLFGYADKNGNVLVEPKYTSVIDTSSFSKIVSIGGQLKDGVITSCKWGILGEKGELLSCEFDSYKRAYIGNKEYFYGTINGKVGVYDLSGKNILLPKYDCIETSSQWYEMIRFRENGKVGCFDTDFKVVVKPSYDYMGVPSYNHFIVNNGGKLSEKYITEHKASQPYFNTVDDISNNVAGGNWGLVKISGKEVIQPKYEGISFIDEKHIDYKENGKFGILTDKYKVFIKPKYDYIGLFWGLHETYFKVNQDGKFGLLDMKGKSFIKSEYNLLGNRFSGDGYLKVSQSGKWGLVDKYGKVVVKPKYQDIYNYKSSFGNMNDLFFAMNNNKFGYVNSKGKEVIPVIYDSLSYEYKYGQSWFKVRKDGKYGYINSYMTLIIHPVYDKIHGLGYGLYAVKKDDKWGIKAARTGKTILNPMFKDIRDFNEGLARVQLNNKWGFINSSGKYVIKPIYDNAWDFGSKGIARVKKGSKLGYTDKRGKLVIKLSYDYIEDLHNGFYYVRKAGKWGLVKSSGKQVISANFDSIICTKNGLILVRLNNKFGYADSNGKLIISIKYESVEYLGKGLFRTQADGEYGFILI